MQKLMELDVDYYRNTYPDLSGLSDAQLRAHFESFGIAEGRVGSPLALRENFLELLDSSPSVLEIGPFCNPVVRGKHVRYFDVLDTDGLKQRAAAQNYAFTDAPEINYVSPTADLGVVGDRFASVVSSHCIEHQPDLIRHLRQVHDILLPGGQYYLLIPHKTYCFDYFIPESSVAAIVDAHHERRTMHRLASVIEHRALTTHNDPMRLWNGDAQNAGYSSGMAQRVKAAIAEFAAAKGGYIDVHAWQFTPASFRRTLQVLAELGLSPFEVTAVFETPRPRNEFAAVLTRKG